MEKIDEGLIGNEKIEDAILELQQNPSEELLAHTLTVIRRRMKEKGRFIVAVNESMQLELIKDWEGKSWFAAFTSFEEELRGGNPVMSTFMSDIDRLFDMALDAEPIEGVILNPWNRTLQLDKTLLGIIKG